MQGHAATAAAQVPTTRDARAALQRAPTAVPSAREGSTLMSISPDEVRSAPWWPELLAIKDSCTYADLSARFGVPVHTLRRALELAGETKAQMPRGPKPRRPHDAPVDGAPADTGLYPLERVRAKVGRMPDAEVAALAGVSVDEVKLFRRENGIAPYLRPPPGLASAMEPTVRVENGHGEPVLLRRRPGTDAPADGATRRLVPSMDASPTPASPASPLAAFRDRLGKVADQVIADEAGVARTAVGNYRRQHGIPAYDGFRLGKRNPPAAVPVAADAPTVTAEPAPPAPPRGRRSKLDAHVHLIGVLFDREVAAVAGVTVNAVCEYRKRHGIPPATQARAAIAPADAVDPLDHFLRERCERLPESAVSGSALYAAYSAWSAERQEEPLTQRGFSLKLTARGLKHEPGPGGSRRWLGVRLQVGPESEAEVDGDPNARVEATSSTTAAGAEPALLDEALTPEPEAGTRAAHLPASRSSTDAPGADEAPEVPIRLGTLGAAVRPYSLGTPHVLSNATDWDAQPTRHAFVVVAVRGDEARRFISVGVDMTEALAQAIAALAARSDGPWRVRSIREHVEALVAPSWPTR